MDGVAEYRRWAGKPMRASPGPVRCLRHEVPCQIFAESVNLAFTFDNFS